MKKLKSYFLILLGVMLVSAGISLCFVPNKIVTGGVSGISTILYHSLHIPAGLSYYAINLVLLLIGAKVLGKPFVVKTVICAGGVSLFTELFSYLPPLTENILLATICGSVLYGFGIGLTLVNNASTGGTDIAGRLIQHFCPRMPIGKLLMIVDGLVLFASFVCFRTVDLVLFGVFGLFISGTAIDYLIKKMNLSKLAFIITEQGREMAQKLVSTSPRGVTLIDVTGAYTNEEKQMLVCALKETEVSEFERKVLEQDSGAFVIYAESQQIVGNGFRVYH